MNINLAPATVVAQARVWELRQNIPAGAKQAAEKLVIPGENEGEAPSAAKQAAEKLIVLRGHGFSRAAERPGQIAALAAEGMQVVENT